MYIYIYIYILLALTIQSVYEDFADEDGFLYVQYYSENMYGEF